MFTVGDKAVVLGGSIAGILTAKVLAERFRAVRVVDRDSFPAPGNGRRGVPQDRHIHALQTRGKRAIEQVFPGVTEELVGKGAHLGDWGRDATMCMSGHRLARVDAELDLLSCTRPLLEGVLRARLSDVDNVDIEEGCGAHALVTDDRGRRVTGVRVLRDRDGSAEEKIDADLVVDATGRGSRLPRWLESIDYPTPEEETTDLEVAYTSVRIPRAPEDERLAVIVSGVAPDVPRGGGAIAVEGDSWILTLGGVHGEQAPTDPGGFVDYAATLPVSDLYDLVRDRELLSEPKLMRYPTSRRRHYEELDRLPEGLVVTGDALCSFNPVYGQGMSVAAAEALALDRCLDDGVRGIGLRFLQEAMPVVDDAWSMAASGDIQYFPDRAAARPLPERLISRYQQRLLAVAAHDPMVSEAFREVMAMVARPPSLLRPGIVARVVAGARWSGEKDTTDARQQSRAA